MDPRDRSLWWIPLLLAAVAWQSLTNVHAQQPPKPKQELIILNWSEYLDPELAREFGRKFDAEVKEIFFESDDSRDGWLAESDGRGYDVAIVNGLRMNVYKKRGWLAPVTEKDVPNLGHIEARWKNAFGAAGYGAPFFWGTLGIAYRSDLVPEKLTSWKQLFQPSDALRGKIVMLDNSRDLVGMALKALGHSANSQDAEQLAEAERLLYAQKPHVKEYAYVSLTEESALVRGEAWVTMIYSGDALMVQEHQPKIVYVLPQEGGNIWVDYLTVMAASSKQDLARAFINFMNEPENAARQAAFVYYATPNKAAEKLMPEDFLQDRTIYPRESELKHSEFYTELPPRVTKNYNRIRSNTVNR